MSERAAVHAGVANPALRGGLSPCLGATALAATLSEPMEVVIQYFDGCPGWELARERVIEAASAIEVELALSLRRVEGDEDAQRIGFRGSPSILAEGRDLFPDQPGPIGMCCRVYFLGGTASPAPSVEQLVEALRSDAARQGRP